LDTTLATGEATRDLIIDTTLATDGAGLGAALGAALGAGGAGLGAALGAGLGAGGAGLGAALGAGGAGLGAGGAGLGAGRLDIEIRSFLFPSCSSLISLSSLLFEESIFSFSNNFLFSTIAKCGRCLV
jgi:hypothetical protein